MAVGSRHARALATLLALTAACGGERDSAPAAALERLAFDVVSGEVEEATAEVVTPIPIPAQFGSTWLRSSNSVKLVSVHTREGEVRALRLDDPALETNLRILRPVEGGAHDMIRLTMATEGKFFLRALARRAGEEVSTELHPRPFPGGGGRGTADDPLQTHLHELDFHELADARGQFSELVLHKPTATRPITIVGIELVDRRGRSPLPSPHEEPQRVFIGGDSRLAVGATPGLVLGVRLRRADGRFAFDTGLASGGAPEGALRVRLLDESGEEQSSHVVRVDRTWRAAQVPLGPGLPGGSVLIEVEGDTRALVGNPRVERPREEAPTVLLITSDTHRADHLGVSSAPGFIDTPVLDALAAEAVAFTHGFSPSNVTNPAHMALMTGVHPRDTGVVDNVTRLSDRARTLAERFQDAGFTTFGAVSAQHLSAQYAGLYQGFDRLSGPPVLPRDADLTTAVLEEWLEDARGLPVFLWLHVFDAHAPYVVPRGLERKYYPADRDPAAPARSAQAGPRPDHPYLVRHGIGDFEYPATQYRAEIHSLDTALGTLLARPRIARGIVAFTADHGESLGEQDVWWDHETLYPSTLHVPLILRWPGCSPGLRANTPVETIDLGRTLLDLAGLESAPFPGRDLRWAVDDPGARAPRYALSAHGYTASLEEDGWFFVLHLRFYESENSLQSHPVGEARLFDLARDPSCKEDRLHADLPRARRMRAALIEWLEAAAPESLVGDLLAADEGEAQQLRELGYAGAEVERGDRWWDPERWASDWAESPWRALFEGEDGGAGGER